MRSGVVCAVLAREPFSRPPEASVNLVKDQQGVVFVAQFAQQRQKARRRKIDASPGLDCLNQNGPHAFPAENPANETFDGGKVADLGRKCGKISKFTKLIVKSTPEKFAMGNVERPVAEAMIGACKRDDARLLGKPNIAVFSAASTASKPELQNIVFASFLGPAFKSGSGICSTLLSAALPGCGCTSPIACGSRASWAWPALTTCGFVHGQPRPHQRQP